MSEIQSLDIITINIWLILISFANLLIIFLILKKFLFAPVQKIFAQRKAQVQSLYDEAETSRTQAAALQQEYQEKMATAREEADSIVRTAVTSARQQSETIVAEATGKATRLRQKAEEDIDAARRQMLQEVRGEIGDLAVSIAEKVVEREIRKEDHEKLVDEFIETVGDRT